MKKTIFSLLLAAAPIISSAKEVVYLKNGSIIKGDIVEIIPNKTLTVETADGSSFVCNYDDIDKITREKTENNEVKAKKSEDNEALATPKIKDNSSPLKRGYSAQINSDIFANSLTCGPVITTVHGFRFNPKISIGLGTGIRFDPYNEDYDYAIPVFANVRYDILNRKISPFMAANSGIAIGIGELNTGFYGSFDFGCRFKRFSLSTGVETAKRRETDYYWVPEWNGVGFDYGEKEYTYDIQSINFILRLGFVF